MIPLVAHVNELEKQKKIVDKARKPDPDKPGEKPIFEHMTKSDQEILDARFPEGATEPVPGDAIAKSRKIIPVTVFQKIFMAFSRLERAMKEGRVRIKGIPWKYLLPWQPRVEALREFLGTLPAEDIAHRENELRRADYFISGH